MSEELEQAIAAASKEAEAEVSSGEKVSEPTEAEVETSPAEEPEKEEVKEAKPSRERDESGKFKPKAKEEETEEEEPLGLSAEELAEIQANEKLLKTYKSMQRGLTKKTTSLSEKAKQLEARAKVADWIESDPDKAVRALAAARGLTIAEAKQEIKDERKEQVADALESEWNKAFGEEGKAAANILRPLFEKTAEKVLKQIIEAEVAPLRQQTAELTQAATARGISAATQEFGARVTEEGGEWNEDVKLEMANLMDTIEPGENTPIDEYLSQLYKIVSYERGRKSAAKEQLKRIRAAKAETEPVSTVRPGKTSAQKITSDMSEKDAIALAVAMAEKEARA